MDFRKRLAILIVAVFLLTAGSAYAACGVGGDPSRNYEGFNTACAAAKLDFTTQLRENSVSYTQLNQFELAFGALASCGPYNRWLQGGIATGALCGFNPAPGAVWMYREYNQNMGNPCNGTQHCTAGVGCSNCPSSTQCYFYNVVKYVNLGEWHTFRYKQNDATGLIDTWFDGAYYSSYNSPVPPVSAGRYTVVETEEFDPYRICNNSVNTSFQTSTAINTAKIGDPVIFSPIRWDSVT